MISAQVSHRVFNPLKPLVNEFKSFNTINQCAVNFILFIVATLFHSKMNPPLLISTYWFSASMITAIYLTIRANNLKTPLLVNRAFAQA